MLRISAILSAILACRGMCSQISKPGTLVGIGLNSPRNPAGALGLRSYMSMCDGPPFRLIMMTDLDGTGGLPLALRRNRSARVRPPTPRAPTRRKSRRERPSHIRLAIGLLRKVNMACSFEQVG